MTADRLSSCRDSFFFSNKHIGIFFVVEAGRNPCGQACDRAGELYCVMGLKSVQHDSAFVHHDLHKLLLADLAILVEVKFVDHGLSVAIARRGTKERGQKLAKGLFAGGRKESKARQF